MGSQEGLPAEIICQIFCFLDPLEAVRLRVVSKQLRDISYDPTIWKTLYANAPLPRPPGPFPHQSTSFLERTLVYSALSAKSWTAERIQDVNVIHRQAASLARGLHAGRWFISCRSHKQFVLDDIESSTSPSKVLWESEEKIASWDVSHVTSPVGDLVYVLFNVDSSDVPRKLLEFRLNMESGELYDHVLFDVPTWNFREPSVLNCNRGPLVYIQSQQLVFDTRTRIFYEFPVFSTRLNIELDEPPYSVKMTGSHIIAFFPPIVDEALHLATLVQIFVLPTNPRPSTKNTCILHLTHETIMPDLTAPLHIIRTPTTDLTSGSTKLRFLRIQPDDVRSFICVDFILPKPDSDLDILPISIHTQHLFSVENSVDSPSYADFIDSSDDGYVRGLCLRYSSLTNDFDRATSSLAIMKFTIDASEDDCVGVCREAEHPVWKYIDGIPPFSLLAFDGARGRICCSKDVGRSGALPHVDMFIVDIK